MFKPSTCPRNRDRYRRSAMPVGGVGGGGRGSRRRQGLPLEQDDDGSRGARAAELRERAQPGPPELEAEPGRSQADPRQPPAHPGRAGEAAAHRCGLVMPRLKRVTPCPRARALRTWLGPTKPVPPRISRYLPGLECGGALAPVRPHGRRRLRGRRSRASWSGENSGVRGGCLASRFSLGSRSGRMTGRPGQHVAIGGCRPNPSPGGAGCRAGGHRFARRHLAALRGSVSAGASGAMAPRSGDSRRVPVGPEGPPVRVSSVAWPSAARPARRLSRGP